VKKERASAILVIEQQGYPPEFFLKYDSNLISNTGMTDYSGSKRYKPQFCKFEVLDSEWYTDDGYTEN
jgi:hypothetical protein